jgi:hypothetical protein
MLKLIKSLPHRFFIPFGEPNGLQFETIISATSRSGRSATSDFQLFQAQQQIAAGRPAFLSFPVSILVLKTFI